MKYVWFCSFLLLAFAFVIGTVQAGGKSDAAQQTKTFKKTMKRNLALNYLLFLPEGYEKADKEWPLIVFLHGAGESGDNLNLVKKHGPPKIVETKRDFPFVVVSPQSPKFGWDVEALAALVDHAVKEYKVDADRVYLTGLSMGGYGTWALAGKYPEKFAAAAPICGGGNRLWARSLTELPIWVFHGGKDTVVPLKESQRMVDAIKERGGKNIRFTVYPDARHDSWTESYDNPELYSWFLKHTRKEKNPE